MVECYWLALARDIPYAQYGQEPVTAAAINDLKRFSGYEGVDAGNLFRGDFPGLQSGPYVSQFSCSPSFSAPPLLNSVTVRPSRALIT